MTGIGVISPSEAKTAPSFQRKNSSVVFRNETIRDARPKLILPEIPNKPIPAPRSLKMARSTAHPRIAVVVGPGRYRNEYGASCVPYARAHGFNITGNANTWPEQAKRAGYVVDRIPEVGAVIVTRESSAGTNTGHVAIQERPLVNGYIYASEQNVMAGMETEGYIPISSIVAFIHPKK